MKLATAVRRALRALDGPPVDTGAAQLAVRYAAAIDAGADLDVLGPLLLDTLDALLLTPRARDAAKGGGDASDGPNPLDELRARRASREHDAAPVDPAAP